MKRFTVLAVAALMAACSNDTAGPTGLAIPQQTITINSTTGTGFVGKGDVQLALNLNNDKMQKAAHTLSFTSSQAGTQAGSQTATQSSTQSVSETLVCINLAGRNVITRAGARAASRSATRSGIRSGTRSGAIASSVDYDPRKKTQVNGFWLRGFSGTPTFSAAGDFTASGDFAFGDYSAWGDYSFGDWVVDANASSGTTQGSLDACSKNEQAAFESITRTVEEGPVVEGAVVEGAWAPGAFTATGLFSLFVNNVLMGSY